MVCLAGILVNKDGVPEEEENFDEAIKAVNMSLVPTRVTYPHCLILMMSEKNCLNICTPVTLYYNDASAKPFGCVN